MNFPAFGKFVNREEIVNKKCTERKIKQESDTVSWK